MHKSQQIAQAITSVKTQMHNAFAFKQEWSGEILQRWIQMSLSWIEKMGKDLIGEYTIVDKSAARGKSKGVVSEYV